jgi:3D (Asp-Asp-Asp) domain-containing protein
VNQVVAVGSAVAPEAVSGELYIGNGVIITADGDVLTYVDEISSLATAYTCEGWGRPGITATGTIARVGEIAVDPKYIPYGTRVFIVSEDGEYVYGVATAEDTGHPDFICGYRIDLYMDTEYECIQFGARRCRVYVLG